MKFSLAFFGPLVALFLALTITGVSSQSCASKVLQVKATAVYTVRDISNGLDAAYQLELANADLVPVAQQIKILTGFADAFDRVAKVSHDLQNVKPGVGVPDSLTNLLQSLRDLLSELNAVGGNGANWAVVVKFTQKVLDVADEVVKIVKVPVGGA